MIGLFEATKFWVAVGVARSHARSRRAFPIDPRQRIHKGDQYNSVLPQAKHHQGYDVTMSRCHCDQVPGIDGSERLPSQIVRSGQTADVVTAPSSRLAA